MASALALFVIALGSSAHAIGITPTDIVPVGVSSILKQYELVKSHGNITNQGLSNLLLKQYAGMLTKSTEFRKLSDSRVLGSHTCDFDLGLALGAVIGMILHAAITMSMDMAALTKYLCNNHDSMQSCATKTSTSCYNGCEWDKGHCSVPWDAAMPDALAVKPAADSNFMKLAAAALACNIYDKKACQASEGGQCEWKEKEFKCDVGATAFGTLMCSNSMQAMLADMATCTQKVADTTAYVAKPGCQFKDGSCQLTDLKFAQHAYGDTEGEAYDAYLLKMQFGVCDQSSPFLKACTVMLGISTQCGMKNNLLCSGDCQWKVAENKCDVGLVGVEKICAEMPTTATTTTTTTTTMTTTTTTSAPVKGVSRASGKNLLAVVFSVLVASAAILPR